MHHAVREDRLWFRNNPIALVRFRMASPGEFTPLYAMGEQPPSFRPSICKSTAPLRWVAVVDLMLRIPAIRSFRRQEKAKAELLDAVAADLLDKLELDHTGIAA